MDAVRFGALVRRLERRSHVHPRIYRLQVGVVAALAYAYVLGVLILVLAALGGLGYLATHVTRRALAIELMFPLLVLAFAMVRTLWIRLPDMQGLPLSAERFPALAAMIERARAQLDAPRFRRLLLDDDFNAAVAQRPRFGLAGPSVSDLIIGLPLMHALSPVEFEAVLAHEMAHVSRRHGRFGHWIYRIRLTWSRLAAVVDDGGGSTANLLLGRFSRWYAPFFNAYSFVLARQDEYEADQAACQVAGRDALASALVRLDVIGRFHAERHWGAIWREAAREGSKPAPHATFPRVLAEHFEATEAADWLEQALRRPTDYEDTHPCLVDRLRALGMDAPATPLPLAESAAGVLLGSEADALARELDERWRTHVEPRLAEIRAELEQAQHRLGQLEAAEESDVEAEWERIQLLERLDRGAEARAAAEALVARHPDHAQGLFFLGRSRLAWDDPGGISQLERAATLHPLAAPGAQALIFDYHWRQGHREEAEHARTAWETASNRVESAERERASLRERPIFVLHDLSAEEVERIRTALAEIPRLRAAYLARRVVVELPELPCYYVGLVLAQRWWRYRKLGDYARLRELVAAAVPWPESTYFVVREGSQARVVRRMRKVRGVALIGRRAKQARRAPRPDPAALERLRVKLARRRVERRRLKPLLVAAAALIVLAVTLAYRERERIIAQTPIRSFTTAQVAQRVRESRGHVLVVVLYNPKARDAVLVGRVRQWALELGPSRAEVLALTIGKRRDAQAFFRYGSERGLPRLAPHWLEPWQPGTLDSTMATVGIRVGATWTVPLVAVVDPQGRVVAQWQGVTDPVGVITAGEAALP